MALVVEDGTGLANAESYNSVAELDAHHAAFGNAAWAAFTTPEKEVRARRGARYLDLTYGGRLRGDRVSEEQALQFGRDGIVDENDEELPASPLPARLKAAHAEAALVADDTMLATQTTPGAIKREHKRLDVLEKEVEYVGGRSQAPRYPVIDQYMRGLVDPPGSVERG